MYNYILKILIYINDTTSLFFNSLFLKNLSLCFIIKSLITYYK